MLLIYEIMSKIQEEKECALKYLCAQFPSRHFRQYFWQ
jgi:hypothetical protein